MLRKIGTWLGTIASIFGLLYALWPKTQELTRRQVIVLTLVAIVFLIAMLADIIDHIRHRPRRFRSRDAIIRYMHRWISRGDRVAIFTRDMTWAHGSQTRSLLAEKARRRELTICLPEPIDLTDELAALGAQIVTYADLNHIPASRFTIINVDRGDARVAIGRQVRGVQVIEEFAAGDHPVFYVAQDLVDVLRRRGER
jgi:hypothetical protein